MRGGDPEPYNIDRRELTTELRLSTGVINQLEMDRFLIRDGSGYVISRPQTTEDVAKIA